MPQPIVSDGLNVSGALEYLSKSAKGVTAMPDSGTALTIIDVLAVGGLQVIAFGVWLVRLGSKVNDHEQRIEKLENAGKDLAATLSRYDTLLGRIDERTQMIVLRLGGAQAD